jgi:hypothetical protein
LIIVLWEDGLMESDLIATGLTALALALLFGATLVFGAKRHPLDEALRKRRRPF